MCENSCCCVSAGCSLYFVFLTGEALRPPPHPLPLFSLMVLLQRITAAKETTNKETTSAYVRTYMHACMHACIHTYIQHACVRPLAKVPRTHSRHVLCAPPQAKQRKTWQDMSATVDSVLVQLREVCCHSNLTHPLLWAMQCMEK